MSIFAFANVAYGQFFPEEENDSNVTSIISGEEKNFTAPKFGLSMQYPSDWIFIPTAPEYQDFTPGIYDYSAMIPPGQASVGKFCANLGINPESYDCELESPAYLSIDVFRLKEGTTLKEFYEGNLKSAEQLKDLVGAHKNIQTTKTNISGLSAIETISTSGKGSLGRLLDTIGETNPTSKYIQILFVNGSTGYMIFGAIDDQKDFETYLPTFQKIFNSIQIQGAKENPENSMFAPDTKAAPPPTQDLVLLSHKLKKGDGNYNDIIGQVKNIGSDIVEHVKIGLTVYNKNGDVVGTDYAYADASTLEPNQKSSFDIFSSKDNFDEMDSYELSLSWQSSDGTDEYVDNAQVYKANIANS